MKLVFSLIYFLILVSLLVVGTQVKTQSEPPPESKMVNYKSGEETVSGFLVTPEGKGPFPAIVVIHEWWGLNDQVKSEAKRLAKEGYVALAVDLYRGKVTKNPEEAHELLRGLPEDRAVSDLLAAISYLITLHEVKKDKIGSIGWCMGGGYSLSLAINNPDLAASVIYYGRLVTNKDQLAKIKASVIGFFGENDRGIPPSSVKEFEENMRELEKEVSTNVYKGSGHAFANEENRSYNTKAAKDSWEKTLAFFAEKLKSDK